MGNSAMIDMGVLYIFFCLAIGGITRIITKNLKIGDVRLSFTGLLIIIGILLGVVFAPSISHDYISDLTTKFRGFDLISVIFPAFIFKTAFQMDMHVFLKSFSQILIISLLGFPLSCVIVGFFITYITGTALPIVAAILFALSACMIDTRSTNRFFGHFKNLGVILAGEEMITTSVSLIIYYLLVKLADGPPDLSNIMAGPVVYACFLWKNLVGASKSM